MSKKATGLGGSSTCASPQDARPSFLADRMLGRLARWLRILGFDTWYGGPIGHQCVRRRLEGPSRILLTRNAARVRGRPAGSYLLIEEEGWRLQVEQVMSTLGLDISREMLFTRCPDCNESLEDLGRDAVREQVPDYVSCVNLRFRRCPCCLRVYWPGTHRSRMMLEVERLIGLVPS